MNLPPIPDEAVAAVAATLRDILLDAAVDWWPDTEAWAGPALISAWPDLYAAALRHAAADPIIESGCDEWGRCALRLEALAQQAHLPTCEVCKDPIYPNDPHGCAR